MNQATEFKSQMIKVCAEHIDTGDLSEKEIEQALRQKLNEQIEWEVKRRTGINEKSYSVVYGVLKPVQRKTGSRTQPRYELTANIIFSE